MNVPFIVIGVAFAFSTAGIPIFSALTKKHFVKLKVHFILQAVFWIVISVSSIAGFVLSVDTIGYIINGLLAGFGLLFAVYAVRMVFRDEGAYLLPYARQGNNDAFMQYVSGLSVNKIQIKTMTGRQYDIVEFTDTTEAEEEEIKRQIQTNEQLVYSFGSKDATSRLLRSLIFASLIIAVGFIL